MNCIKRQKDTTPKDESSRLEGVQYATTNSSRKNEVTWPKWERSAGGDVSVMKVKSSAVNNSIA